MHFPSKSIKTIKLLTTGSQHLL